MEAIICSHTISKLWLTKTKLTDLCEIQNAIQLLPILSCKNKIVQIKANSAGYQEFSMHEF